MQTFLKFLIGLTLLITLSEEKSHRKCGHRCEECETDKEGNIKCLVCPQGYQRSNYQCFPCEIDGCGQCNKNAAMCTKCIFGYYNATRPGQSPYIQYVYKCNKCPEGCQICNKDNTCEICTTGFRMGQDFHCTPDDHDQVFWVMLIVLFFFGVLFFLAMRMRVFFKKKESNEHLETDRDLNLEDDDIEKPSKGKEKPKMTIVTAGERRSGRTMTIGAMKLNRALKPRKISKHIPS